MTFYHVPYNPAIIVRMSFLMRNQLSYVSPTDRFEPGSRSKGARPQVYGGLISYDDGGIFADDLRTRNPDDEEITMCALEAESFSPAAVASSDTRSLRDMAHDALQLLMTAHPELARVAEAELWIERAVAVLAANIASGRFASACRYAQEGSLSLSYYAQLVLGRLMAEWEQVEALRAGDSLRWTVALRQMERQAYFWLGPTGREEWAKWEAREAAAKTVADLWDWLQHNTFPFDVTFDRWAERALRYRLTTTVRLQRREARHVVDSLDRPCFEEDGSTFGELLPNDDLNMWLEREIKREALRQGAERLDQRQAHIIHRWYVEGWSADEIAAETRLEVNHIYVLKHRALKKLREYCAEE
jgi:RNA polymerase sigma factor (sigma-70 family)